MVEPQLLECSEQPSVDLDRMVVGAEPKCPDRFGDGEAIDKLQTDLIDGFDQIVIIDLPPLIARKQVAGR